VQLGMSAKGQKRTSHLLDHSVGASEQRGRGESEGGGRFVLFVAYGTTSGR
jgi:hypothetical protein